MKIFSKDELLELKEKTKNCRITNPMFEDITVEDSFNEYVEAYKEYDNNNKLKRMFDEYCVGKFKECSSIVIEDNFNIKNHFEDFLIFQFNIQLIREIEPITLYVSEDENYTLDWQYNADDNVYEVSFNKDNGESITLNKSLEDLDEQLKYEFDSREFDEDATNDFGEWLDENKEDRIEIFEYEYICDLIDEFTKEYILNHN